MFQRLLFATDLLEGSHKVSLEAKHIAEKFEAELYIMHVVESPLSAQYAQALGFAELVNPPLDNAQMVLSTLADELDIPQSHQIICQGRAGHQIIEKAKALSIDAIIIGSHSVHALPQFLGSTANTIVHKAHCDVITLRTDNNEKESIDE